MMIAMMGPRSRPPIGDTRRRIGASTGSVTSYRKRTTGLYGSILIQLSKTRANSSRSKTSKIRSTIGVKTDIGTLPFTEPSRTTIIHYAKQLRYVACPEDRPPDTHNGRAFFNRHRVIIRHSHTECFPGYCRKILRDRVSQVTQRSEHGSRLFQIVDNRGHCHQPFHANTW